jgi:carbon storage regulator
MLILVRKVQQSIWIEGDIHVKVLSVERDRVKLGITAPGEVKVMREELFGEDYQPGDEVTLTRPRPAAEQHNHKAAS